LRSSPACSSARNASRTGPRDTFSFVAISTSFSFSPGAYSPDTIARSSMSWTIIASDWLCRSSMAFSAFGAVMVGQAARLRQETGAPYRRMIPVYP